MARVPYPDESALEPSTRFQCLKPIPLRIAVSGSKQTPPLHGIMDVLGPEEVHRRVEEALLILQG